MIRTIIFIQRIGVNKLLKPEFVHWEVTSVISLPCISRHLVSERIGKGRRAPYRKGLFVKKKTRGTSRTDVKAHLKLLDERGDAGVRLVVVLLVGKFPQLWQEGDGIPRGEQGQQVRGQKLSHSSPRTQDTTP